MFTINSDKAWNEYGKNNPYYGVLTYDEFLDKNLSDESKKQFFKTGDQFVARLFNTIHKKIDATFVPNKILDFGCGTGRLTLSLAKRGTEAIGMDVSTDMLSEAEKNAAEQKINNATFLPSDDQLSAINNMKFDLVNSYIVLQHINIERGLNIFNSLVESLNPNGIGVVQFTYQSNKSKAVKIASYLRYRLPLINGIMNLIKGNAFNQPLMQMNSYHLNEVFAILQQNGIKNSYQELEEHGDFWGVTIYFQKEL
jgi:2-polyprenyl-3-methyl-5-hydroxy-6-metoxy-1,4-benzoquinol methylase